MKKLLILTAAFTMLFACKKETSDKETTDILDVQEKNMGVYAVRTATWCEPCGNSMNGTQDNMTNQLVIGNAVPMAFKDAFIDQNNQPHSDWGNYLFDEVRTKFDLAPSVPHTFYNFSQSSVGEHVLDTVIVSGNYNIDFDGNKMTIKTTTKFFKDYLGDVYLTPFVIVNNLVGFQSGHPDSPTTASPNTVHKHFVADVAYPTNFKPEDKHEWGYRVAAGQLRRGQNINMEFTLDKKPHWANNNISIVMVYFRKVNNDFLFLNAFTKQ
jgi:hypothetical protein